VITVTRRVRALATATALVLVFAVAFAIALVPGAAYAVGPVVQLSPPSGPPGTTIRVTGTGFCAEPCERVRIQVGTFLVAADVPVTDDGRFGVEVEVPTTIRPGEVPVLASQHDPNGVELVGRSAFVVTGGAAGRVQPTVGSSAAAAVPTLPDSPSPVAAGSPAARTLATGPAPNYPGLAVVTVVAALVIAAFLTLARRIRRQPAG
jgi:hypothetical protein